MQRSWLPRSSHDVTAAPLAPRFGWRASRALPSAVSAGMRPSAGSTMSDVRRLSVSIRPGSVMVLSVGQARATQGAVHAPAGAAFERLHLFLGVELLRAEVARPLERRDGPVVPRALQIGMAPGCPRRRGVATHSWRHMGRAPEPARCIGPVASRTAATNVAAPRARLTMNVSSSGRGIGAPGLSAAIVTQMI